MKDMKKQIREAIKWQKITDVEIENKERENDDYLKEAEQKAMKFQDQVEEQLNKDGFDSSNSCGVREYLDAQGSKKVKNDELWMFGDGSWS